MDRTLREGGMESNAVQNAQDRNILASWTQELPEAEFATTSNVPGNTPSTTPTLRAQTSTDSVPEDNLQDLEPETVINELTARVGEALLINSADYVLEAGTAYSGASESLLLGFEHVGDDSEDLVANQEDVSSDKAFGVETAPSVITESSGSGCEENLCSTVATRVWVEKKEAWDRIYLKPDTASDVHVLPLETLAYWGITEDMLEACDEDVSLGNLSITDVKPLGIIRLTFETPDETNKGPYRDRFYVIPYDVFSGYDGVLCERFCIKKGIVFRDSGANKISSQSLSHC